MFKFNHFDFLAPYYDRLIKPGDPEKLRTLAGLPINGNLLDVGGGTGRSSLLLNDLVPVIVIADSSIGMLTRAKKKANFKTVCSNSEALPFCDESFERVIMVDALHHVQDYRITLTELWRVVIPGGCIVIEEPDIRTFAVKLIAIFEKITLMRSHFISPLELLDNFHFTNSKTRIVREGSISWVIIEKTK